MLAFFRCLISTNRYKAGLGKTARQATMLALMVVFVMASYRLFGVLQVMQGFGDQGLRAVIAGLFLAAGCWLAYRAVNFAPFADFLGSVEAEMVKVSWPTSSEIYSSTIVVLSVFFLLALLIFCFDMVWFSFFKYINVM